MRVAALDLGTNTFLLLIAEMWGGSIARVLHDEVRVVRLGQGVHENRSFHPDALKRAEDCFRDYAAVMKSFGVERVLACATSAARDVSNGSELIRIAAQYGIPVEIISGEKEAEYTFWGTFHEEPTEPVAIIDIGGGSTEYILGDQTGPISRKSLDIGSVRLTEMFVTEQPVPVHDMQKMTSYIQEKLNQIQSVIPRDSVKKLIAVAGTPTTLAAVDQGILFDVAKIDGYTLPLSKLRLWVQKLAAMSIEERQALVGMEPKRADVIVAGSLILMLSCQCLDIREIEVSTRGLRYGVARDLANRKQ